MNLITNFKLNTFIKNVKANFKSGLTVALVSIPLSIAISIASGAGPISGIITGFWATILASLFGGSKFNIIGPAGALISVLFAATLIPELQILGNNILPIIAIFSGLIIMLIYFLKLHKYIALIPECIVHGFAAGVAFVIASSQLREALGIAHTFKPSGHFINDISQIFANINHINLFTFIIFLFFLIFLIYWKKNIKSVPGVIPASILGILSGFIIYKFNLSNSVLTIGTKYGELKLILINFLNINNYIPIFNNLSILITLTKIALIVAIISILETLITAKIGDILTKTKFNSKKEVFGLGLSNIFSGLFGGLPATGVFIRTGLNIKSGASNYHSALIAGLITGFGSFLFMPIFKYIPMSVIAAILMMTAIGLIDLKHFLEMYKSQKLNFSTAIITAVLVVISDPLIGVGMGTLIYFSYVYLQKYKYSNIYKLIKKGV